LGWLGMALAGLGWLGMALGWLWTSFGLALGCLGLSLCWFGLAWLCASLRAGLGLGWLGLDLCWLGLGPGEARGGEDAIYGTLKNATGVHARKNGTGAHRGDDEGWRFSFVLFKSTLII